MSSSDLSCPSGGYPWSSKEDFGAKGQWLQDDSGDRAPLVKLWRSHSREVTAALSPQMSYAAVGNGVEVSKRRIIEEGRVKTVTESGSIKLIRPLIKSARMPTQPATKLPKGKAMNYLITVELDGTSFPVIHGDLRFFNLHRAIPAALEGEHPTPAHMAGLYHRRRVHVQGVG